MLIEIASPILGALQQVGGDVSFSGAEIALVGALLTTTVSALSLVFKMYLSVVEEQKKDLRQQILDKQKEIEYWQYLAEHGTVLSEVSTDELKRRPSRIERRS